MEEGGAPRDVLRRRVRTAEFYYGTANQTSGYVSLYDEFTDNFVRISGNMLGTVCTGYKGFAIDDTEAGAGNNIPEAVISYPYKAVDAVDNWLLIRPCIEHYMLAAIIGRGGLQHLGATLW